MADSNALGKHVFKFLKIENMVVMTVGKNNILHINSYFNFFAILFASLPGSITAQVWFIHTICV